MSRTKKPRPPKNKNDIPGEASRKSINPKSPEEQVQAIADDMKSELISWIYRYSLEQELVSDTVTRVLGIGGGHRRLDDYIDQLKTGFKGAVPGNQEAKDIMDEKDNAPDLKRVSRDEPTRVVLPKDKNNSLVEKSTTRSRRGKR